MVRSTKSTPTRDTCHGHELLTLERYDDERLPYTTPALLCHSSSCMPINILFDTGALQGNYLSEDVAARSRSKG